MKLTREDQKKIGFAGILFMIIVSVLIGEFLDRDIAEFYIRCHQVVGLIIIPLSYRSDENS